MCLFDRTRRKKYEGRSQKRCGTTWTNETRKWYERPKWEVRGYCNPHSQCFRYNQTNSTLQISKTRNSKETKLVRFLCQLINQSRCLMVSIQKQEPDEVVIQASCTSCVYFATVHRLVCLYCNRIKKGRRPRVNSVTLKLWRVRKPGKTLR